MAINQDVSEAEYLVADMKCIGCIRKIERGLVDLEGVTSARANLSTRRLRVHMSPSESDRPDILGYLKTLGFKAYKLEDGDIAGAAQGESDSLLLPLAVAGFAAANIMLLSVSVWAGADEETRQLFQLLSGLIAVPAVAYSGRPFFRSAGSALQNRRLNMDVPISLAVLLALFMSTYEATFGTHETYFDAAVTLLFFLLSGRYLDQLMRDRARLGVQRLMKLMPSQVTKIGDDGASQIASVKDVRVGDTISIMAGERLPVDSVVTQGTSEVDRSAVSGETQPIFVSEGQVLEAGTLNLTSAIRLAVTKTIDKSFVAETIKLMEAAEQSKSSYVRIADRAAQIYAPLVHLLALFTFIGWLAWTNGDWHTSLYIAISVLIITCPCALGLAVPVTHVVAANRFYREGLLVKDGAALEKLSCIDTVVFDKTGTLTLGKPTVYSTTCGHQTDLRQAISLARCSNHPMAKAIAEKYPNISDLQLQRIKEYPGLGVEAYLLNGKCLRLGRSGWVSQISQGRSSIDQRKSSTRFSKVCFASEGGVLSSFYLEDTLRPGARRALDVLRSEGRDTAILSGDRKEAVKALSEDLNVEVSYWQLKPRDKVDHIQRFQRDHKKVLYVGDGINDAPALATADVSIAPSSASDVGRQSADIVFIGENLACIPQAIHFASKTQATVHTNFGLAIAYNCIAIPLAVFGLVTPLVAAIAMSASSILVVANSLRLNWVKPLVAREPKIRPRTHLHGSKIIEAPV